MNKKQLQFSDNGKYKLELFIKNNQTKLENECDIFYLDIPSAIDHGRLVKKSSDNLVTLEFTTKIESSAKKLSTIFSIKPKPTEADIEREILNIVSSSVDNYYCDDEFQFEEVEDHKKRIKKAIKEKSYVFANRNELFKEVISCI